MVDRYIQKARQEFKVRPILPFGLGLEIGTVGTLEDDQFVIRGTSQSILRVSPGATTPAVAGEQNWLLQSGRDVKATFVPAGQTSSLFPNLPSASARVELSFGRDDSYLCVVGQPKVTSLADPASLIGAISAAYSAGGWPAENVLVYQIVTAESLLVLGSKTKNTNILLSASGDVGVAGTSLAKISGTFGVMAQTQDVIRFESGGGAPVFYNAYRVKKSFLGGQSVERFAVDDHLVDSVFARAT